MKTIEAKATVVPVTVPAETVPGPYGFAFFNLIEGEPLGDPAASVLSEVPSCTVQLPAGDYRCVAQRYAKDQTPIGDSAYVDFEVEAGATITVGAVGGITVSQRDTVDAVRSVSVAERGRYR